MQFPTLYIGLVMVGAAGFGCRPPADEHGHDHPEEPKTAQITVWTQDYEVFAEHQAPVAGESTTFITHVTDLNTGDPRREGMVKFVLRQGENVVEHPQAAPARAGIYLPGIRFPQPGDWEVSLLIPSGGTNAMVDLGTVKVYADDHAAAHAEIPEAPEGVSFLKEQQWKITFRSEPATQRGLVERVRVPARVMAKPGNLADVIVPVSGHLSASPTHPYALPGMSVEAGQILALLKPNFSEAAARLSEAEAEFQVARAALEQAEREFKRVNTLAAKDAKSPRELQEAQLAFQSAQARYASTSGLLATFKSGSGSSQSEGALVIELSAPISGIIDSISHGPGALVSAGQTVFTLLNPETVWVEGHVPEMSVPRLSSMQNAVMEIPGAEGEFIPITGNGHGRLISLGMKVEEPSRTVRLLYEVLNAQGVLRIGQNLILHVETAHAEETLAIPDSALVEEGDQLIAYVHVSGETFAKREIKAGIQDRGFVQVLDGIKEGERVVTEGAYAIRLSSISGVIPAHGHAH